MPAPGERPPFCVEEAGHLSLSASPSTGKPYGLQRVCRVFGMARSTAYYLKEDLRQLWHQPDKARATAFLQDWIARAQASSIPILISFATTLQRREEGILAYFDYPISTGPLEGTNNKIKTMKRQAYGFRDHDFFILKIMAIHEATYALVG